MDNSTFMQSHEAFTLNSLQCLRNEYLYNDCTLCFSRCESDALGLFKNKITLFQDKCTQCGDCLGVCPTEALSLEIFDTASFVLEYIENESCSIREKIDIPSFGLFDVHHLLSIVIRKEANITLLYHENMSQNNFDYIAQKIRTANDFLAQIQSNYTLSIAPQNEPLEDVGRRGLFKNLLSTAKELKKEQTSTKKLNEHQKEIPAKNILLKNSLKSIAPTLKQTKVPTNQEFLFEKSIHYERCTNCVECITFCPTGALFQNSGNDAIWFQSGKCIGCGICTQVCKQEAIEHEPLIDIVSFAFDRADELVKFQYANCDECKQPFVYKGGELICHRCAEFANNFSDMFTMAKDIR